MRKYLKKNKINQIEKEKRKMSKPMGNITVYEMRLEIQTLIRRIQNGHCAKWDVDFLIDGFKTILKSYELELKYREQIACKDDMEFFAQPWKDDRPEIDDEWKIKSGDAPTQTGLNVSISKESTKGLNV